jgi:hypothetical protein
MCCRVDVTGDYGTQLRRRLRAVSAADRVSAAPAAVPKSAAAAHTIDMRWTKVALRRNGAMP